MINEHNRAVVTPEMVTAVLAVIKDVHRGDDDALNLAIVDQYLEASGFSLIARKETLLALDRGVEPRAIAAAFKAFALEVVADDFPCADHLALAQAQGIVEALIEYRMIPDGEAEGEGIVSQLSALRLSSSGLAVHLMADTACMLAWSISLGDGENTRIIFGELARDIAEGMQATLGEGGRVIEAVRALQPMQKAA